MQLAVPVRSMRLLVFSLFLILCWNVPRSLSTPIELAEREASPEPEAVDDEQNWMHKRTYFPESPPSCQICEMNFGNIDSCANASIVFANITNVSPPRGIMELCTELSHDGSKKVIYNPLLFIDVINCACTDTFKSTYPQCVDCFEQTNQTVFLEPSGGANLSTIVTNIRSICALGGAVFGGVASANSQLPGQTPITVASAGAALRSAVNVFSVHGTGRAIGVAVGTVIMSVGMGVWTVL